ncbi:hypothetical protein GCM10027442_38370 [Emticicia fontis]
MAFSQSVTIMPDGITPVQSGTIPRLSYEAIMALPNPQNGDMAYDLSFNCVRFYKKTKWVKLLSESEEKNPSTMGWRIGGNNNTVVYAVATDIDGNVYLGGAFTESAIFDGTEVIGETPTTTNLFIAKYTNTGSLVWVQKAGYGVFGYVIDLELDSNGNIFMTGHFYNSVTIGTNTLTTVGGGDFYLLKYNNSGAFQWVQQVGGFSDDNVKGLCIDSNGNPYLAGNTTGSITIGGINYSGTGNNVCIIKYNTNGNVQWLRKGGTNSASSTGIAVGPNGSVTMIGYYTGTSTFYGTNLTSAGMSDVFLVQFESDGDFVWAKSLGGTNDDYGYDVAINNNNDISILGYFFGTATFGSNTLTSAGSADVFIAQLNSAGTVKWAKRGGGSNLELARSLVVDPAGNIYIMGEFTKPSLFGNITLSGMGIYNIYVAKYNINGVLLWAEGLESHYEKTAYRLAADTKGNLYCAGSFKGNLSTDDAPLVATGTTDGFVVRMRD